MQISFNYMRFNGDLVMIKVLCHLLFFRTAGSDTEHRDPGRPSAGVQGQNGLGGSRSNAKECCFPAIQKCENLALFSQIWMELGSNKLK